MVVDKQKIPPLTVLIVDDEDFLHRELTSLILHDKNLNLDPQVRANIKILHAKNGAEALALLQQKQTVNLILLDIVMPIMDGYEICKIIRSNPEFASSRGIPIFFISGTVKDTQEHLRGLELEADEVFSKPFDPLLLGSYIKKELKRQIQAYQRECASREQQLIAKIQERAQKQNVFHFVSSHTYSHSARVEVLTTLIGSSPVLALSERELYFLKEMVREHDKGKIGIPEEILNKPQVLSERELSIIQMHTAISSFLINAETANAFSPAVYGELFHHEKYLGQGYPSGRPLFIHDELREKADKLPNRLNLLLSIVSFADALDALTSKRPYKEAASLAAASQILVEYSYSHFDPLVAEALFERLSTIEESALKRIDQSATRKTVAMYRLFRQAFEALRTSGFYIGVTEYYRQDAPEIVYASASTGIREFFFQTIIAPYIEKTVREELARGTNRDPTNHLGQVFRNQLGSLSQLQFNPFLCRAVYLEIGCSYRFLAFRDVETVKEQVLLLLPSIERLSSRIDRLGEIYNACLILFLLQTIYYVEYLDLNNVEHAEYLLGEYNLLFELWKGLRQEGRLLCTADYTLPKKIMSQFYIQLMGLHVGADAAGDRFMSDRINALVNGVNATWQEAIAGTD